MELLIAHGDASARAAFARVAARVAAQGVDVIEAGDGQEVLERLLSPDGPQVAVVDWDMPEVDGLELCRIVNQFYEARPPYVILIAGPAHDIAAGLDAGASDCVRAPVDAEELRARLGVARRYAQLLSPHEATQEAAAASLQAEIRSTDQDDQEDPGLVGGAMLESVLMPE
jgi:DNA-binding response OmpR family regulator